VYIRNPPVLVNFGVQTVSAGSTHTMAVKTDGTLWAWGDNARGELGDGTWTDRLSPFQVMTGVQAVSGGQNYTMVVKRDGSLWATGSNAFGQLGDGTGSPRGSFIRIPLPN
jgi:alpha-tubulin suppressor-like RCC1 family protein